MNKSILIVDTPESCLKCEFSDRRLDGTLRCTRNKDSSNVVFGIGKDKSCPLKEIPNVRPVKACGEWLDFNCGYNACIEDILKGIEE